MSNFQHGMVFETDEGELVRLDKEVEGETHQWECDIFWNGSWACTREDYHDSEFVTRRQDMECK